jgi:hypothetical protein
MGWAMGIWISGKMIYGFGPVLELLTLSTTRYDNICYVNIFHAIPVSNPYGDTLNGSRIRFKRGIKPLTTGYALTFGIAKTIHRAGSCFPLCFMRSNARAGASGQVTHLPYIKRYTPFRFARFGSLRFV